MVDIISLNCQGLGNNVKRRDVFNYIRNFNANIYCLQDTHFTQDKEIIIRSEWGYECLFSSFCSNSRGVCILFNNNFGYKINKVKRDVGGNYLNVDMLIDDKKFTLCNLYGPNTDSPQFLRNIF